MIKYYFIIERYNSDTNFVKHPPTPINIGKRDGKQFSGFSILLLDSSVLRESFPPFFFGCIHSIWKFPGQGLNQCHSNDPSRCSECWILNLLFHKMTPFFFVCLFLFCLFGAALPACRSSQATPVWDLSCIYDLTPHLMATPDP